MRRGKGLLATALAAVAGLALAGCGSDSGTGGAGGGSVTMWIYPVIADEATHRAYWDDAVKRFTAAHPGTEVTVEYFPWANRDQALTTAIAGNKGPDVVYLIPDQIPKYANNIEPIDGYLDGAAKSEYHENVVEAVTVDGKMMGAPILATAQALVCNKKVFEAVGQTSYPRTWDDLLDMAPKFKAAGYDVANYNADVKQSLNITFYPLLWQAGGDVFTADGKSVAFDGPAGVKALTFAKRLVDGGFVDKASLTTTPPIEQTRAAQGKVACTWQLAPQDVAKFWGKENIKVLPPLKDDRQVQYGTVGSLVMLKGARNKRTAGEWIKFATATDAVKKYDTAASYLSPKKSTGDLYAGDPVLGELEKTVSFTAVGPLHPKARDVMGLLAPEIQAALVGDKSPEQALSDAAKAARSVVS
jgi:multiple sugar transport system substrate-binding protein